MFKFILRTIRTNLFLLSLIFLLGAVENPAQTIISDDFNTPDLNSSIWNFVNPLNDASYTVNGYGTGNVTLSIEVPGGISHDVWRTGINAPRIMQPTGNTDFEIEAKFESTVNQKYQAQGIIVEDSPGHIIRFDMVYDGFYLRMFVAVLNNPSNIPPVIHASSAIFNSSAPYYLRLGRNENMWTFQYSYDGNAWISAIDTDYIEYTMNVSSVGIFAANAGTNSSNAPAHTAIIDYFFNTASPIDPEDGGQTQIPPVVQTQPVDQTVMVGETVSFSISAAGSQPLSYQWQKNEIDIPSANQNTYTTPPLTLSDNGSLFRCIVTNDYGSATSNSALLTVIEPGNLLPVASFTANPLSGNVPLDVFFDASGSYDPDGSIISYSWDFGDGNTGNGITASHTYTSTGSFNAILTVTDNDLATHLFFRTITVNSSSSQTIISDDFNSPDLNSSIWNFVNPLNDASYTVNGYGTGNITLSIEVPGGISHDVWRTGINAPRIMQSAGNTDFEIEAKFESTVNQKYQTQGIIVEDSPGHLIRFDMVYDGFYLRMFVAVLNNPSNIPPVIHASSAIFNSSAPYYLRLGRIGNMWTFQYSYDGSAWTSAIDTDYIEYTMNVSSVGIFAANAGTNSSNAPAHTAIIDYFFNTASPIDPEDGGQTQIPPVVQTQLVDQTVMVGETASFSISAAGSQPLSYQWQKNEIDIPSANQNTYTTPLLSLSDNGSLFRCIVTNDYGSATSNSALLTVIEPGNLLPVASFTANPLSGNVPLDVFFDASGSYDPDGSIISYSWDFGDGNTGNGITASHTYTSTGSFNAILTVTDNDLATDSFSREITVTSTNSDPIITVWYGDIQRFGHLGNPQRWVNILGNVSDSDGIKTLSYTLNGGSSNNLSVGPDTRRLGAAGDFAVEIDTSSLQTGINTVEMVAMDSLNNSSTKTVLIDYSNGNSLSTNYAIDWDTVSNIQNVAQVVDGKWTLESGSIGVVEHGYDRNIAIGNVNWTNYEVTVPLVLHDIHPVYAFPSFGAGIGILVGWTGHTGTNPNIQPRNGFLPFGAYSLFEWSNEFGSYKYKMYGNDLAVLASTGNLPSLQTEILYYFKLRVEATPNGPFYSFKSWKEGEVEPTEWLLSGASTNGLEDPQTGSILLVAHNVDVSFGDISVVSLNDPSNQSPVASFTADPTTGLAPLTVSFDASGSYDPDGSIISYSWDFGDDNSGDGITTSHTYTSTGIYNAVLTVTDSNLATDSFSRTITVTSTNSGPAITIWYGDVQRFGHLGNPQRWVDILGNVSSIDGIQSLTYSLNDSSANNLHVGPDTRRLSANGDFTIEIDTAALQNGNNTLLITAVDSLNITSTKTVIVDYSSGNSLSTNYTINWDTVSNIQNVAQVVDGKWELDSSNARVSEHGYDRNLAIGNVNWTDYEITVPFVLHGIHPVYAFPSYGAGIGILAGWTGHTEASPDWQPRIGILPFGAYSLFEWSNEFGNFRYKMYGNDLAVLASTGIVPSLATETTYYFKLRVESTPDGPFYSFKSWKEGEVEPLEWLITGASTNGLEDPQTGSVMLVAHHVDVSFGEVNIVSLNNPPNQLPVANFIADQDTGFTPLTVFFDATSSYDPDGDIISYEWYSGDSTSAIGDTLIHVYNSAGIYNVRLIVTDNNSATDTMFQTITVEDSITITPILPYEYVFLANENVEITKALNSEGKIHSNKDIKFRSGSSKIYKGDLTAVHDITIESKNTIDGDVTAGNKVNNSGNITGIISQQAQVDVMTLPQISFNVGSTNIEVPENGTVSLDPGYYKDVKLRKYSTLQLVSGEYFFNKLETDDWSVISIDVTNGTATVNIKGVLKLDLYTQIEILPDGEAGSPYVTFNNMENTKIEIGESAKMLGYLVAPLSEVKLKKKAFFKGAILAKKIIVEENAVYLNHGSLLSLPKNLNNVATEVEKTEIVTDYELQQNYPNPFNPSTIITFAMPEAGFVRLNVYNILGQRVATLFEGYADYGIHSVEFNASNFSTGIYIYRIKTNGFVKTQKMILSK